MAAAGKTLTLIADEFQCDRKTVKVRIKHPDAERWKMQKSLNHGKVRDLFLEGKTIKEIAEIFEVHPAAVTYQLRKLKMRRNDSKVTFKTGQTPISIAYAAGIFDGEGSISIGRSHRYKTFTMLAQIINSDLRVIEWFKEKFGGYVWTRSRKGKKEHHYTIYTWAVSARAGADFLGILLPYLIIKREQAVIGIELQRLLVPGIDAEKRVMEGEKLKAKLESYRHGKGSRKPPREYFTKPGPIGAEPPSPPASS